MNENAYNIADNVQTMILRDGNDVLLQVKGFAGKSDNGLVKILDIKSLQASPTHLRLTGMYRAVQTGLTVFLYWEGGEEHDFLTTIEGYGVNSFDWCSAGLTDTKKEGFTGNVMMRLETESPSPKHFSLVLEFAKQRG